MDQIAPDQPMGLADQAPLPQHVRHAVNYIRANMAGKITLSGLASACDVSERTLHKQFRRFLGASPLAYLHQLRLNVVRAELTEADHEDPISDIASRNGFSHLGRFAIAYQRHYRESPSSTRKRVRADAKSRSLRADDTITLSSVPGREKPSLLILPLHAETLREKSEARELTERIAATLSRMRVVSVKLADPWHPASMKMPRPKDVGARYCLVGRLTQRDPRTRVIVRLVDVATDQHIWGDSFDGVMNDPFELQDHVIEGVLFGVVSHITEAEIERARGKDPRDLLVRDLTLQAVSLIHQTNVPGTQNAIALLDRAVETDPGDAVSVALLAFCHAQLANFHGTTTPRDARDTALRLSKRASMLDNGDPLALMARGAIDWWLLRFDEGDALLSRALAMDPTSAWAWEYRGFARLRYEKDSDRAIADIQRSLRLRGPGTSRSSAFHGIAVVHWSAGRFEEAFQWTCKALAENPDADWMHRYKSCCAAKMGDLSTVERSIDCMRRARPHLTVSLIVDNYALADTAWLEAVARAGLPLG
jgi:AraC-like DNA-binding protein/TolB-like protein